MIENFFRNLFPLAYHHAVHSRDVDDESMQKDFHVDYKNCLEKSFETLQPFGDIPQSISRMLVQSVGAANVLLRSIEQGARIVGETENLPIDVLSVKCQHALLKMNYCASCKGHNYHHSRPCYGYCSNVVRLVGPPPSFNSITKINDPFLTFLSHFFQRLSHTVFGWLGHGLEFVLRSCQYTSAGGTQQGRHRNSH